MKKAVLALLVLVAFGAFVYFAPHLAARAMRSAARERDAETLSSYIDYPSLRQSLSTEIQAQIAGAGAGQGPGSLLRSLGAAFAAPLVDPMIDALVTPENLALMMSGQKPARDGASPPPNPAAPPEPEVRMGYESASVFVLTVTSPGSPEYPFGFVLQRTGLFGWKLAAVRLPRLSF